MKKTFLAKRNGLLSSAGLSWSMGALTFALLVLAVRLAVPNFFWYAFTPVFRAADALALQSRTISSGFQNVATLAEQNERLIQENIALTNEKQALLQRAEAVQNLSSGILAGVVARPPESPYDTFVLAAGTNAGVARDMRAFGAGGVPLGTVSSVSADFSRVTLFSAPGVITDGWVGRAGVPISIEGAGAGALRATVSRGAAVQVGDMVFAPGPGMLPIGTVARIDRDPSTPNITLHIQSVLNLFSIAWVTLRDGGVLTLPS